MTSDFYVWLPSGQPDENLGPMFLALSWTTMILATVLVALRLYVRCRTHANSWDDYLIYFALVSAFIPRVLGSHAACALSLN